jgi:hypothetical protein
VINRGHGPTTTRPARAGAGDSVWPRVARARDADGALASASRQDARGRGDRRCGDDGDAPTVAAERPAGPRGHAPAEVVLRMLVLKQLRDWSYDELEREVTGSLVYRRFCRIDAGKVPDAKTMVRWGQVVDGSRTNDSAGSSGVVPGVPAVRPASPVSRTPSGCGAAAIGDGPVSIAVSAGLLSPTT